MKSSLLLIVLILLSACDSLVRTPPTLTPTRALSAPPLAASPTIRVRSSDELYDNDLEFIGQSNPTVAALPVDSGLPPISSGTREPSGAEVVQVVLNDGTTLVGDLYQQGVSRVPGVLMLSVDRVAWGILPRQLQDAGMTVLVITLHPTASAANVDTLLLALSEIGTVDPSQVAVIGAGSEADLALLACSVNPICDATVLLSPLGRDTLLNVMGIYNPRPMMLVASQNDTEAYPTALALVQAANGQSLFLEYPDGRGTALLQFQPTLANEIVAWLARQLNVSR